MKNTYDSLQDAQKENTFVSLFLDRGFGKEIRVEDIKADELRKFLSQEGDEAIIITQKKPRGNFSKDDISIIDMSLPKSKKEREKFISQRFSLSKKQAQQLVNHVDDTFSLLSLSQQLELVDYDDILLGELYNPQEYDMPPWDITDAIVSGDVENALRTTKAYTSKYTKNSQYTSLMFQIIGYIRKVIIVSDDTGNIIEDSKRKFFFSKNKKIKDKDSLIKDIDFYSKSMLETHYPEHTFHAMIASMTSQFKG